MQNVLKNTCDTGAEKAALGAAPARASPRGRERQEEAGAPAAIPQLPRQTHSSTR